MRGKGEKLLCRGPLPLFSTLPATFPHDLQAPEQADGEGREALVEVSPRLPHGRRPARSYSSHSGPTGVVQAAPILPTAAPLQKQRPYCPYCQTSLTVQAAFPSTHPESSFPATCLPWFCSLELLVNSFQFFSSPGSPLLLTTSC